MLINLLPGVRELRTPLAAGYILLLTLYFALIERVERPPLSDSALIREVVQAADFIGVGATLAAATFGAYLVGSVWADIVPPAVRNLTDFGQALLVRLSSESSRPSSTRTEVCRIVLNRLEDSIRFGDEATRSSFTHHLGGAEMRDLESSISRAIDLDRHVDEVTNEYRKVPALILGKEPEIWSAYDRLRSECEFRLAVGTALTPLSITMWLRYAPLWLCIVPVSLILWIMGRQKYRAARTILLENVMAGRIQVPSFAKLADPAQVYWINGSGERQMGTEPPPVLTQPTAIADPLAS